MNCIQQYQTKETIQEIERSDVLLIFLCSVDRRFSSSEVVSCKPRALAGLKTQASTPMNPFSPLFNVRQVGFDRDQFLNYQPHQSFSL